MKSTIKNDLDDKKVIDHRDDYLEFFGVWSKEDLQEFHKNIKDLESIDLRDWEEISGK
jgi:hypothetical protein